jgi:hypothetical protein
MKMPAVLKVWRIKETFSNPTYVVEFEEDYWTSWTDCAISIEQVMLIALNELSSCHIEPSAVAFRCSLIVKIKDGEYNDCIIAVRPKETK